MAWNPEDYVSKEVKAEIRRLNTAVTPSREAWLALANLLNRASDVFLKGLAEHPPALAPLSADSINMIVAAPRLAAKPADEGVREVIAHIVDPNAFSMRKNNVRWIHALIKADTILAALSTTTGEPER